MFRRIYRQRGGVIKNTPSHTHTHTHTHIYIYIYIDIYIYIYISFYLRLCLYYLVRIHPLSTFDDISILFFFIIVDLFISECLNQQSVYVSVFLNMYKQLNYFKPEVYPWYNGESKRVRIPVALLRALSDKYL